MKGYQFQQYFYHHRLGLACSKRPESGVLHCCPAVERSGDLLDCLSDPVYCVSGGHVLGYGEPMMSPGNRVRLLLFGAVAGCFNL
jgi:hypothetical protein